MDTKLSLIHYILKRYDRKNNLINDTINFIISYNDSSIINNFNINETNQLSNYILSYLNDDITDDYTYRLCLAAATYVDNYDKISKKIDNSNSFKRKILINVQ